MSSSNASADVRRALGDATLLDYWLMIYSRKWLVLTVGIIAAGFAAFISSRLEPVYESRSSFMLRQDAYSRTDLGGNGILQALIPMANQDLAISYTEVLKGRDSRIRMQQQFPDLSLQALQNRVAFEVGTQGQIVVYVRDPDPDRAAQVANAYVDYCRQLIQDPVTYDTVQAMERIEQGVSASDDDLQNAIAVRSDFLESNDVASVGTEREGLQKRYLDLQFDLERAEIQRESLEIQIESLETSQLQDRLISMRAELEATEVQIAGLRRLITQTSADLSKITAVATEFDRLSAAVAEFEGSKRSLRQAAENIGLGTLQARGLFLLVETATPSTRPVFPIIWKNVAASLILGMLVGMLYAFALEGLALMRSKRVQQDLALEGWVASMLSGLE